MEQNNLEIVLDTAGIRPDGKRILSCPQAFRLAEEHNIPLSEIGEICNSNDIKIVGCQLGCFK
jgi:hypothetical protein